MSENVQPLPEQYVHGPGTPQDFIQIANDPNHLLHSPILTARRRQTVGRASIEKCISLWHLNICGLDSHHHQLEAEVEIHQPDIIGLTETHHVEDPKELQNYTFVATKAPATNKSGTGIYIKDFQG